MSSTTTGHLLSRINRGVGVCVAIALLAGSPLPAASHQAAVWKDPDGNPLPFQSDEEIVAFLLTAEIESVHDLDLGVTDPRQVVLEKEGVRMRAVLRDYDETFTEARIDGVFYARLRDSFIFDVPAYELSRILGLRNIPPVTFRNIGGKRVTLQAWLEGAVMETDRGDNPPPSFARYRQQTQDMRVFDSIIGNVDRNTGNILMDEEGNVWLIDHSRAFMRNDESHYLERVTMCSRRLFERIKTLQREELMGPMSPPLTDSEVDWVLRRRDKVVAHIEDLIATRGEDAVLFDGGR